MLSIVTQFLSNRSRTLWWMVVRVNRLMLCQECHRAAFLGLLLFLLYILDLFSILANKLISHAKDSTLISVSSASPRCWLLCQPQALELLPKSVSSARLVSDVTFHE